MKNWSMTPSVVFNTLVYELLLTIYEGFIILVACMFNDYSPAGAEMLLLFKDAYLIYGYLDDYLCPNFLSILYYFKNLLTCRNI
jgi:hypothetical protein